jgi:hypothetical protein
VGQHPPAPGTIGWSTACALGRVDRLRLVVFPLLLGREGMFARPGAQPEA